MSKLPPFDFDENTKHWGTFPPDGGDKLPWGEPTDEIIERGKLIANMVLAMLNYGLNIDDLTEIPWYNRMWDINDDDELLSRVKEELIGVLYDSMGSAKEKKAFIEKMDSYYLEDGKLIVWVDEDD